MALCEQLLAELAQLTSADDAAVWAKKALPKKTRLTEKDAQRLELGFALALSRFDDGPVIKDSEAPTPQKGKVASAQIQIDPSPIVRRPIAPKSIRLRDPEHRKFVARQGCLICGRRPCDAHHVRYAQPQALGAKVSDEFTVPLCRTHHREVHTRGDERKWWAERRVDPLKTASTLWQATHSTPATIVESH